MERQRLTTNPTFDSWTTCLKPNLQAQLRLFCLSQEPVLLAVARNLEVGIDVEFIRTFAEVEQIIERFFSDREKSSLRASPPDKQQEALCNSWTCKEAYLRTAGIGLIQPLEKVGVLPDPRQPAKLLSTEGNKEASRWSLNVFNTSLWLCGHSCSGRA